MDQQDNPLPGGDAGVANSQAAGSATPRPARVVPFGGSKWAPLFAGGRAAPVASPGCDPVEPGMLDGEGQIATADIADAQLQGAGFWLDGGDLPLGMLASDVLPAYLAARGAHPELVLCGPRLSAAQAGLLGALGLSDLYMAPGPARRFVPLLVPRAVPAHVAPVDERTLDLLGRLRPPVQPGAPAGLAILPRPGRRFSLRNQASVVAWLRARRVPVLAPDGGDFDQTAARLSTATLVLIAEPAQAGLLAFCQPGTRIVELAAEGWAGARTRTLCAALGLNWRLFLGGPPTYPISAPLPFGAPAPMAFEISIALLNKALTLL